MNPCPTQDLCPQIQPPALYSAILVETATSICTVSLGIPALVEAPPLLWTCVWCDICLHLADGLPASSPLFWKFMCMCPSLSTSLQRTTAG